MHRDPEIIRRDIQIATLMAENLRLRAERDVARAQAQAHELADSAAHLAAQRDAFAGELVAANREISPPPAPTAPSGRPLVVETALADAAPGAA